MIVGADGWLESVRRVLSPNFDQRPAGCSIELIVLHNISLPPSVYGGRYVEQLFTNSLDASAHPYFAEIVQMRVSAHVFLNRDGCATQFVSFDDRAWHAGASVFDGREGCNDFSIGVELEGSDFDLFTDAQYTTLNALIEILRAAYPIKGLCGHSDIAPGRKTDPGPFFDWTRIFSSHALHCPST